ncbi:MAG TPA: hypothetical protein VF202_07290 [Trueperaceae bacterium]
MRPLLAFLALCSAAASLAQRPLAGAVRGGVTYVSAAPLAVALGDVVTSDGETLTWRGAEGVATFFAGSADALLQRPGDGGPVEWALAAPVLLEDGSEGEGAAEAASAGEAPGGASGWLLPLDAVQLLGVAAEEGPGGVTLLGPGGEELVVTVPAPPPDASAAADASWEPVSLGAAAGVRFFSGDQSLLLLDLDLLPLAYPEAMAVVDEAIARAGSDHALLLIATSLAPGALDTALAFAQEGRELVVRAPYRVHVFRGDPAALAPGHEVVGVVLLPATFSLYRPLTVSWAGVEATVTLRR